MPPCGGTRCWVAYQPENREGWVGLLLLLVEESFGIPPFGFETQFSYVAQANFQYEILLAF